MIPIDSLYTQIDDSVAFQEQILVSPDSFPVNEVSLTDFFGADAVRGDIDLLSTLGGEISDKGWLLHFVTILLLLLYVLLVHRYGRFFKIVWKMLFSRRGYHQKILASSDVNMMDLVKISTLIVAFDLTLLLVDYAKEFLDLATALRSENILLGIALAGTIAFISYFLLIYWIVCWLSARPDISDKIYRIYSLNTSLTAFVLTPFILICVLQSGVLSRYMFYVLLLLVFIGTICRLIALLKLFIAEKISFLQYILYFCTVEIVPASFVLIFICRNIHQYIL